MNDNEFKRQLISLYKQSFDETDSYVDFFFARRYKRENVVAVIENGRILSALHLIPQTIMINGKPVKAGFVSSAATLKDLRGQGIFFQTMEKAYERLKADGTEYCVLYPFKHDYYKKHGFIEYTYVYHRVCGANPLNEKYNLRQYTDGDKAFVDRLISIYEKMGGGFSGYVIRDFKEMLYRIDECLSDSGRVYLIEGGGAEGYAFVCDDKIEECAFTDFNTEGRSNALFATHYSVPLCRYLIDSVKELYGMQYCVPVNMSLKGAAEAAGEGRGISPFGMIKKIGCAAQETFDILKDGKYVLLDKY